MESEGEVEMDLRGMQGGGDGDAESGDDAEEEVEEQEEEEDDEQESRGFDDNGSVKLFADDDKPSAEKPKAPEVKPVSGKNKHPVRVVKKVETAPKEELAAVKPKEI